MHRLFCFISCTILIPLGGTFAQEIVPLVRDELPPELIFRELPDGRLVGEVQIPERRLPLPDGTGETTSESVAETPAELNLTVPPAEVNLAGRWLLTLPAGWQQRATIEKLEDGRYRLPGHGNLNGIYVLDGRTLTLDEYSEDPKPHFVWEVLNDNTLRLRIDENHAGANYLGATMGRQIDWDDFADNSRTTSRLIRPALVAVPERLMIRPSAPQQVTLTGQAFNDESQPPYIETEDDIIFMQGLDAWPEDVVSKIVTINGLMTNGQVEDGATTLPARFVQLQSYSVEGGPIIELGTGEPRAMSRHADLQRTLDLGIVAIIRAPSGDQLVEVSQALLDGGVDVIEVTFTVPGVLDIISQLRDAIGDRILLGAGTVLDAATARAAMLAGAEFIVTPAVRPDVIEVCQRYDKLVMCGAFTPTEILHAWELGSDIVKVFPADIGGPGYLQAIHGPFPQIRLLPTGGVNLDTLPAFVKAGACAVGLGSALVEKEALKNRDMNRIRTLAAAYVAKMKSARG